MMIKVCGITRREDALAAASAGASALGFIFYPKSPRYVAPARAAELGAGLPLLKVGIFVEEAPGTVAEIAAAAKLDVVQLYGGETPRLARVWRAVRIDAGTLPGAWNDAGAEALLLDGAANGMSFDWKLARNCAPRVIVAGGLDASNVGEAIRLARPWGVDASSRLETAPGIKDHASVRAFVEAARAAFEAQLERKAS